jgi:hypothetical protein
MRSIVRAVVVMLASVAILVAVIELSNWALGRAVSSLLPAASVSEVQADATSPADGRAEAPRADVDAGLLQAPEIDAPHAATSPALTR